MALTCQLFSDTRQANTLSSKILFQTARLSCINCRPALRVLRHGRVSLVGCSAGVGSNNAGNSTPSGGRRRLQPASANNVVNAAAIAEVDEIDSRDRQRLEALLSSTDEEDVVVPETDIDPELLFENTGLSPEVVKGLHAKGFKALFAIQKDVFVPSMEGKDVIARAKTGSGKTLAFALPVIEKILKERTGRKERGRRPLCIVLAPTRELASQVHREMASITPKLDLGCYYGGTPYGNQERELRQGIDIVVGTPGRIIDLIDKNMLDLSEVKYAVLDEADQMLNVGFEKDVETILDTAPEERQTLLFSATMPKWVKNLTRRFQRNPVTIDLVGDDQSGKLAETIKALAVQVTPQARRGILVDVLTVYGSGKTIVFTQTKREADEVAAGIAQAMPCEALHGDITQSLREKILQRFRDGKCNVLVATDVAARGLDIPDVDLVVHYELPQEPEGFLHRSGRTGRAGKKGTTVALYTPKEVGYFKRILRETETMNIQYVGPPTPKQVMHAAAQQVVLRLNKVDDDVKAFFMPAARMLLDCDSAEERVAAALAALSGRMEVPQSRSLITLEEGQVTLRVMVEGMVAGSPGQLLGMLRRAIPGVDLGKIGRIRLLMDGNRSGGAFDLPEEQAVALLQHAQDLADQGIQLDRPVFLPAEESSRFTRDDGARRYGGGSRSNGGGSRDKRGGGSFGSRGGSRFDRGGERGGSYGSDRRSGGSFGGRDSQRGGYSGDRFGSADGRDPQRGGYSGDRFGPGDRQGGSGFRQGESDRFRGGSRGGGDWGQQSASGSKRMSGGSSGGIDWGQW